MTTALVSLSILSSFAQSTKQWTGRIQTAANGTFNRKYNMTIPKEMEEYEG